MRIKRLASKFFELEKRKNQNEYKIFACVVSNVGMQRKNNEDNYILSDEINVGLEKEMTTSYEKDSKDRKWFCAGVFDGMGGGSNGELAALWAAQSFYCTFEGISPDDYESIDRKVRQCFLDAHNKIVQGKPDTAMYGTTGTVFLSCLLYTSLFWNENSGTGDGFGKSSSYHRQPFFNSPKRTGGWIQDWLRVLGAAGDSK